MLYRWMTTKFIFYNYFNAEKYRFHFAILFITQKSELAIYWLAGSIPILQNFQPTKIVSKFRKNCAGVSLDGKYALLMFIKLTFFLLKELTRMICYTILVNFTSFFKLFALYFNLTGLKHNNGLYFWQHFSYRNNKIDLNLYVTFRYRSEYRDDICYICPFGYK